MHINVCMVFEILQLIEITNENGCINKLININVYSHIKNGKYKLIIIYKYALECRCRNREVLVLFDS